MYYIEQKIIDFYAKYIRRTDSYKDSNDKGLFERYNEIVGKDIDENVTPFIYNAHDNLMIPTTILTKMIPILEYGLGISLNLEEDFRRIILQYITKFYQVKGTIIGYRTLFEMLGFSETVVTFEDSECVGSTFDVGTFDSNCTFDSGDGALEGCNSCYAYKIFLTGDIIIDDTMQRMIDSIVEFNEPINAQLIEIVYIGESGDFNDDFNNDFLI